jgi:predicted component of type VI protein secretion system
VATNLPSRASRKENELNATELNKLKDLAGRATKGPWMTCATTADNGEYTGLEVLTHDGGALITEETHPSDDDARFIAAANPRAVMELIALAEKAEQALAQASAAVPVAFCTMYGDKVELFETKHQAEACQHIMRVNGYPNAEVHELYRHASPSSPLPDLSQLQRYENYGNESGGGVQEAEDGEYVLLSDVEQLFASAREGKCK